MSDEVKKKSEEEHEEGSLDKTSVVPSETFKVRLAQAGEAPPAVVMLVGPANSVGRQWSIEDTDRILGRSEKSHIFVDDKSVSKSHAKLILSGGDVSLVDLESTNKTVINGRVIPALVPVKLNNNDQIKTGNIIFKFLERGNTETVSTAETFDRGLTDALTGAHNRGALDAHAIEAFKRSNLLDISFSIVTFDIDHFKKVNDTYGHDAGDYVLQEIVTVIKNRLIRENDFFARSGGEEFTLILLGGAAEKAKDVAERIRHTIETHSFVYNNIHIPITISVGVSRKTNEDTLWDVIYKRADQALYTSKHGGRNQVTEQ